MKSSLLLLSSICIAASPAFAESDSGAHASAASTASARAAGESALALAASAATGVRLTSGIAAVPLWMAGNVSATVGAAATGSARTLASAGNGAKACRPKLDPAAGMPARDPAPAAAMNVDLNR